LTRINPTQSFLDTHKNSIHQRNELQQVKTNIVAQAYKVLSYTDEAAVKFEECFLLQPAEPTAIDRINTTYFH
jgi:hypothetical protein